MAFYRNNKDGTRTRTSSNINIIDVPVEEMLNYVIEGLELNSIPLTPITEGTDEYEGTAWNDKVLSNCPSLSDFYALYYDKFINMTPTGYTVTKKSLGKEQSGTYDIYEYDFCPANWERMILLSSGMNGYEVGSLFGLAYFLDAVINNHDTDPVLNYIYRKVRIKVIPMINPWGYSQSPKDYRNSRGVNLNRNFDWDGRWYAFPVQYDNNYKGTSPFSEAESYILREWGETNKGADFYIDCHTAVSGAVENKELYFTNFSTSPLISKITAAKELLSQWIKRYYNLNSIQIEQTVDGDANIKGYWWENTLGMTQVNIEQCSDCASIGNINNGDQNSIVNYAMLIYGFVGALLTKEESIVASSEYIQQLLHGDLNHNVLYVPHTDDLPIVNTLTLKQGSLNPDTGAVVESTARVYTEGYIPIRSHAAYLLNIGDSDINSLGRVYLPDNYAFDGPLVPGGRPSSYPRASLYRVVDHDVEHSWFVSDITVKKVDEIGNDLRYIRLIFANADRTSDITPQDLAGRVITVDGVRYKLVAST